MVRHLVQITAASLLIVAFMFLPFLPGGYDGLATTLSGMAQLFGVAGLLLAAIGAAWLAFELRMRGSQAATPRGSEAGRWFALASIGAATLIALLASVVAFSEVGLSLGLGVIALWAYCAVRLARKLKAMTTADVRAFNPAPLYLVVLPIVAAISNFTMAGPAAERSRDRAIQNSAQLIADIERYRDTHGHYPPSLLSVWADYKPAVIGVRQYHYELNGDAYNVFFQHLSVRFGTREFVMYNKRDEHEMTSHAMDLLTLRPGALTVQRGYYAVHNASRPHWRYFWFD